MLPRHGGKRDFRLRKPVRVEVSAEDFYGLHQLFRADEFIFAGAEGIDADGGEHVPQRHGAVILVAGEAVVFIGKQLVADFFTQ